MKSAPFHHRYLSQTIQEFLEDRMVFLGGPRQVGKTTLCLQLLKEKTIKSPGYFNWDRPQDRSLIRKGQFPADEPVIVLDEVHKFKMWRNLVKGFWDKLRLDHQFLVTGSARLDHYRRGGDSLFGRYRYLRLHPLSLSELGPKSVDDLLKFGGFPEPFFRQSEKLHRLWSIERRARIVNDDIRDLERLVEYSKIELLAELLPDRVRSLLSLQSLSEDLEVDPKTVEHWIQILERVYYCYRILPFGTPKIRAIRKQRKLFLWDWSQVPEPGPRFENMVASHLLKYCHFLEDTEGEKMELRFLQASNGREIDFVVLKNRKPLFAVECKTGERAASSNIHYFSARTQIPYFFQVHLGTKHQIIDQKSQIVPFSKFFEVLKEM